MPLARGLICPFCHEPLTPRAASVVCGAGHTFDVAREGYLNLLPGKPAGDSREMLLARRRFLEHGHYRPIALALGEAISAHLAQRRERGGTALLEVGCGEGYYLRELAGALIGEPAAQLDVIGLDLSREAVRLAARRSPEGTFVVADVHRHIPLASGSVEVLVDVFSPRSQEEFARVVAPGGLLLIVIPQPDHLQRLRTLVPLIGIQEGKQERLVEDLAGAFSLQRSQNLAYDVPLGGDELSDLVAMSPSARHLDQGQLDRLAQSDAAMADVRVALLVFHRRMETG